MDNDMLSTDFLTQPRGPGTAYLFRMRTPLILVGKPNPRTGRPYGREIRESLGGTRNLREAIKRRDLLLGAIRAEEARAVGEAEGSISLALDLAEALRSPEVDAAASEYEVVLDSGETVTVEVTRRELILEQIERDAETIERKAGAKKAGRWANIATGKGFPLAEARDKYLADRGKALATSTQAELKKAVSQLIEFAGEGATLQDIGTRNAGRFVTEFLPTQISSKAPSGPSPATVQKKVTVLNGLWVWAMDRGYLERDLLTPWYRQAPTQDEVKKAANVRRPFTPEETVKLLNAVPAGDAMGDLIRVALLTGARLEEVAALDASQVEQDATGYHIRRGKTENAARYVPLVDEAQRVIKARLKKAGASGQLFPEFPKRNSSGKHGGAASQKFTRLRREILGEHTDDELALHSFRHTWRTAARRAGVDFRTSSELGGWSLGRASDLTYDHGLEREQYRKDQQKVGRWLRKGGYLAD